MIGRLMCRLGWHRWQDRLYRGRIGYYEVCERPDCESHHLFMRFQ